MTGHKKYIQFSGNMVQSPLSVMYVGGGGFNKVIPWVHFIFGLPFIGESVCVACESGRLHVWSMRLGE